MGIGKALQGSSYTTLEEEDYGPMTAMKSPKSGNEGVKEDALKQLAARDNKKSQNAAMGSIIGAGTELIQANQSGPVDPNRPRRRGLQQLTDTFNAGMDRRQQMLLAMSQAAFEWAKMRRA